MSEEQVKQDSKAELKQVMESAQRLGVELDEEEALQWLAAIAAAKGSDEIVMDPKSGVFGHRVTMLDFSPQDLAYFRSIGRLVEFEDEPGVVETALALSGSAAQSKIQAYPGDCDYFERVNIIAPTREEACRILSRLMREKALSTCEGDTYRLIEVKFGNYPQDVVREGRTIAAGSPIAWTPVEIEAGQIEARMPDGSPVVVAWDDVALDPGWCKLDWVVADPVRQQLANASNMLDVTWEAPDGTITPLDGYLDAYFQEVYLEAESIPIFSKLVKHVSANALGDYVEALEHQVEKYVGGDPVNYGKAAKRMYNIFRLTGRYEEAAYLRELFDEPAALLYQVWALIRTVDEASDPGSTISTDSILAQMDDLIVDVVRTLEDQKEAEIVRYLLRLRDGIVRQDQDEEPGVSPEMEAARAEVINLVNNFFYERLMALPTLKSYIEQFQA